MRVSNVQFIILNAMKSSTKSVNETDVNTISKCS